MGAKNIESRQPEEIRLVSSSLSQAEPSAEGEASGLERLREILVGGYLRETEKRSERFERHFSEEASNTRREIMQRVDAMESRIQDEIAALEERFREERNSRVKDTQRLNESLERIEKDLRRQAHEQVKALADDLARVRGEIVSRIDHDRRAVDDGKVDRTMLASMLADLISRLSQTGDLQPPRQ